MELPTQSEEPRKKAAGAPLYIPVACLRAIRHYLTPVGPHSRFGDILTLDSKKFVPKTGVRSSAKRGLKKFLILTAAPEEWALLCRDLRNIKISDRPIRESPKSTTVSAIHHAHKLMTATIIIIIIIIIIIMLANLYKVQHEFQH